MFFSGTEPFPRALLVALSLALLAIPGTPALAEDPPVAEQAVRSATVAGLLELLRAGMTEDIVLLWLDTRKADAEPPAAADLVALRDAGASDVVLARLLSLPAAGTVSAPEEPTSPEASATRNAEPATEATLVEAVPPRNEPATTGEAIVQYTLSYVPEFRSDEKEWSLYVYLDGKPLGYVAQGSRILGEDALRFEAPLAAGRHQIRIAQENHEAGERSGDFHEARMAPVDLLFQLQPGEAEVEISVKRSLLAGFGTSGSIDYRIAQFGRVVLAEENAGGDPDGWTPVCDDATASGVSAPRDCRTWPSFWTVEAPARSEVLRALALFEYRPVPINQRVH